MRLLDCELCYPETYTVCWHVTLRQLCGTELCGHVEPYSR